MCVRTYKPKLACINQTVTVFDLSKRYALAVAQDSISLIEISNLTEAENKPKKKTMMKCIKLDRTTSNYSIDEGLTG